MRRSAWIAVLATATLVIGYGLGQRDVARHAPQCYLCQETVLNGAEVSHDDCRAELMATGADAERTGPLGGPTAEMIARSVAARDEETADHP